jgi:hypothetical protein
MFEYQERKYLMANSDQRSESINDLIFPIDYSDNYIRDSPFTEYFKTKIESFDCKIKYYIGKNIDAPKNNYYYPNLFSIIRRKLHLVPLWSGILISTEQKNFPSISSLKRFTNNPVERWFGYFRNDILDINKRLKTKKRLLPSEIITPYYNYLQMKFKELYESISPSLKSEINSQKTKNDEEKWTFKSKGKKRKSNFSYYSSKFRCFPVEDEIKNVQEPKISQLNNIFKIQIANDNSNHSTNSTIEILDDDSNESVEKSKTVFQMDCFRIKYEFLKFRDIYELLNDEMISDNVIL